VSTVKPRGRELDDAPPTRRRARIVAPAGGRRRFPEQLRGAVSIVVPTYNTGPVIPDVLRTLVSETDGIVDEILVIDNASDDGTPDIVRRLMEQDAAVGSRVRLLVNPTNLGYGGSIKRGFAELADTAQLVAVIHSDAQCDAAPTLMDMVCALSLDPQPDVVLASRFLPGAQTRSYSLARRAGNVFFNTFTRALSGLRMSDAGTGIMLVRVDALRRLPFDRLTSGYQFHPQLNLLIYSDPQLVVAEVPLAWRDAQVGVKFSLTNYALTLTRMLLTFAWHRRVRRHATADAIIAAAAEGA
jgi:glycosyltransferase involved in cell wall biosynthesis